MQSNRGKENLNSKIRVQSKTQGTKANREYKMNSN